MSTITLRAEINPIDVPIFETLLKKFKAKKVVFEETNAKRKYIPNAETIKAFKETDERIKNGTLKKYTNIDDLFNDLLTDDE